MFLHSNQCLKMASGQSGEKSGETFHDIEVECNDAVQGKLALQLHISQPGGTDH